MRTVVVLVVVALLGVVGLATYARVTGLSALPAPPSLEVRTARAVRGLAVPSNVRAMTNPQPATPETLMAAMAHFADHCSSCHANDGSGNVEMGRNLYPKAPDMRAQSTQQLSDGELFWIIEHGVRFTGMPGWSTGTAEGEKESWQLVQFIRHLPELTDAEKVQMESLNPRSPTQVREEIEEERFLRGDPAN